MSSRVRPTGWYNNCQSWSAYFSRGTAGAFIDLNMKKTEADLIFSYYLPMVVTALVLQLIFAGIILWINKDTLKFTIRSERQKLANKGERGEADATGEHSR